jgi:hypothetical protein
MTSLQHQELARLLPAILAKCESTCGATENERLVALAQAEKLLARYDLRLRDLEARVPLAQPEPACTSQQPVQQAPGFREWMPTKSGGRLWRDFALSVVVFADRYEPRVGKAENDALDVPLKATTIISAPSLRSVKTPLGGQATSAKSGLSQRRPLSPSDAMLDFESLGRLS